LVYGQNSKIDALSDTYAKQSFPILKELLSIPNDAFYPDAIDRNLSWCETAFGQRGFSTRRIETSTVPLLLAERKHNLPANRWSAC